MRRVRPEGLTVRITQPNGLHLYGLLGLEPVESGREAENAHEG
jgi:hypothetical protein